MENIDLTIVWAFIIAFAVVAYVILDGFDLGVGILFPFMPERGHRDVAMNSVAPVWDGNETWLVLGGGGLLAAFPLAYAILLSALYVPVLMMMLGLIFRGVAFEYRWRTERWRRVWDVAFALGSTLAAFFQGVALGAMLQGIKVTGRAYSGGWWDWLTPFSVLTGAAVVTGYALLGATWLVMKTSDELQDRAYRLSWLCGIGTLAAIAAVSLWTPFLAGAYWKRWFEWPGLALTAPVPIALALTAFMLARSLTTHRHEYRPFLLSLAIFLLCFIGLGVSIYPYVIPGAVDIWQAASPRNAQMFMLVGALVLVPIILAYTAYAYWVFRGKVDPQAGYH